MERTAQDAQHWNNIAAEWIAWARAPNHDAFWAYRDAFRAFVGPGATRTLDVGCGEGRVARTEESWLPGDGLRCGAGNAGRRAGGRVRR